MTGTEKLTSTLMLILKYQSEDERINECWLGEKGWGNILKNCLYIRLFLFETYSKGENVQTFNHVIWYILAFVCEYSIYQRNLTNMNCIIFILIHSSRLVNYNCTKEMQPKD